MEKLEEGHLNVYRYEIDKCLKELGTGRRGHEILKALREATRLKRLVAELDVSGLITMIKINTDLIEIDAVKKIISWVDTGEEGDEFPCLLLITCTERLEKAFGFTTTERE